MLVATRLTDEARAEWLAYLTDNLREGCIPQTFLDEIDRGGNHGVNPDYGLNFEIAARYSKTGHPNSFNVPADHFIWEDDGESKES